MSYWSRRQRKNFLQFWIFVVFCLLTYRSFDCVYGTKNTCLPSFLTPKTQFKTDRLESDGEPFRTPKESPKDPTVNLVVASVAKDDISWTERVAIPNMAVVRYVSDDPQAKYHPSQPVGRESLMYFTYMHDFYDNLPDISIFVHADEMPWHMEPILQSNMSYALSRLDLAHVAQRKYVNLRILWLNACPDWINTTHTEPENDQKQEEPFMKQAFIDNFRPWYGDTSASFTVPEILAQPCCNQFAVTRDAIRSVPLIEYKRYMQWLISSSLATSIVGEFVVGRFWEHSFQYLFTGKPVDCPNQWKAFCLVYGICFDNESNLYAHMQLDLERDLQVNELGFWKELWHPINGRKARERIKEIDEYHQKSFDEAILRGNDWKWKAQLGNLYSEWADGEVLYA